MDSFGIFNGRHLHRVYAARGTRSVATGALSCNSFSTLPFTGADTFDTDNIHNNEVNTSRLTAKRSGYYFCCALAYLVNSTAPDPNYGYIKIIVNGNTGRIVYQGGTAYDSGVSGTIIGGAGFIFLEANDYIELQTTLQAASGGTYIVNATAITPFLAMVYLGE